MKILENTQLWMTDVAVADVFITNYLPLLSSDAVKVYLFAKHIATRKEHISQEELLGHLNMTKEQVRDALCHLAQHSVIDLFKDNSEFTLRDLKQEELLRNYRPILNEVETARVTDIIGKNAKEELWRSISDSFYHGLMNIRQQNLLSECITEYGFSAEVVYSLFAEVSDRGKLSHTPYIQAIAKSWSEAGVSDYESLKAYSLERDKLTGIVNKVCKYLNRNYDKPTEKMVTKWVKTWGFTYELIAKALSRSVQVSNAGLNYYDKILQTWYEQGLKTAKEIDDYTAKNKSRKTRTSKADFSQREQDDKALEALMFSQRKKEY